MLDISANPEVLGPQDFLLLLQILLVETESFYSRVPRECQRMLLIVSTSELTECDKS